MHHQKNSFDQCLDEIQVQLTIIFLISVSAQLVHYRILCGVSPFLSQRKLVSCWVVDMTA